MNRTKQSRVYLFPQITQSAALEIASRTLAQPVAAGTLTCHGKKPSNFRIYASPPEPCWWVQIPWGDGKDGIMIRSSRVIVIDRRTGVIHYDGPAGDEG